MNSESVFVEAAREAIAELPEGSPMRVALRYLLVNARGSQNAKPLPVILRALRARGVVITGKTFQTTLLKETRASTSRIFIGSGPPGFFLIDSEKDVKVMHDFYVHRIMAERQHDRQLLQLARRKGWAPE